MAFFQLYHRQELPHLHQNPEGMAPYFIGIDGGGSKTLGTLQDSAGVVQARARDGGSSIIGAPSDHACAVLAGVKARLCADAGVEPAAIAGIGLGLNGIDFADEFALQHEALSACLGIAPAMLTLVNDGIVALWGASPAAASVIIHHGSGFTHAWRARYGDEQPFDHLDVGKTFDIRHGLTALVARMLDGRVPATPLREAALAYYGVAAEDYAEALFRGRIPRERIRTAPVLAFAAWQDGDPAATGLVDTAAAEYAGIAVTLAARTGDLRCHVAFGGGVINHAPEAFLALLTARVHAICPDATVARPWLNPADGAALMAAHRHGLDPVPLYERMLACRC
jgi:N-acetylglucosamine kinase-like BadF-type ATPase